MPGRSNGLPATSYLPLVDLDPQLADAVLELLRDEGIAAYAVPAGNRPAGAIVLPRLDRPLDRVYADAAATARARSVLEARLPALRAEHDAGAPPLRDLSERRPAEREDEEWARIVASYDAPVSDPVPRWPVVEDLDARPDADAPVAPAAAPEAAPGGSASQDPDEGPEGGASGQQRPGDEPPGRLLRPARPSPAGQEPPAVPEDEDEHFVPPPPPPLPRTDPVTKLAWAGLLGSPLAVLLALLVGRSPQGWLAALAVAAFVGGFATLVVRMQDRPRDGEGPDDGAVV